MDRREGLWGARELRSRVPKTSPVGFGSDPFLLRSVSVRPGACGARKINTYMCVYPSSFPRGVPPNSGRRVEVRGWRLPPQ